MKKVIGRLTAPKKKFLKYSELVKMALCTVGGTILKLLLLLPVIVNTIGLVMLQPQHYEFCQL